MIGLTTTITQDTNTPISRARKNELIAVVFRSFAGGGATREAVLLCNALVRKGIPVAALALRNEGPLRSLLDPAIQVVDTPSRRMRYAVPGLRRAIRALSPRLVLSSESGCNLCCLAAVRSLPRRCRPKIVLWEVATASIYQKTGDYWQHRLAYRILRHCYRYSDRIITLSDGARLDLIENFNVPTQLAHTLRSNAVIPPEVEDRVTQWDGEQGREPHLIVAIGRLSPQKNFQLLLNAATQLRSDRPWRLALVGDGPDRAALEEFVRANGLSERITFVGFVPDPFVWMMRASVAVCSSIQEGLCNVIIEALSCGTPVVSTDCPFGPREILQGGRYGTLVPMGDAAALASAIDVALDGPVDRATLIARGLNHTAERAANNFLEIVADL